MTGSYLKLRDPADGLSRNRKPKSPSLPSGGIQSLMEEADSDVMLLYDCCNSAATTTSESQQSQAGVTEVIAACGYESIAPEVGEHSFTNALMQTLAAASKGVPFSVGELHNRILNRLKCWTPSVVKDENGKMMEDENGILQYERQPRRTPIYSILVESNPRRSILLAPFRESQRSLATSVPSNAQFATGQNNIPQLIGKRKRSPSPGKEIEKFSQVILSIQLRGDQLDIQAWRECIRLFPVEAQAIKIEGIYDSFSTLLLIRLPVAVWNLLPKNPAYSFVGYVTSGNRGPSEVIETRQDLPKTSKSAPIRTSIEVEEPIPQGTLKKYYEAKPKATSSEDESPPPVSKRSRWRASKLGDLSSDEDISPPPVSRKSRWRASKFGDHKILDDIRYFWFSSDEDWFSDDDEVDEIEVPLSRHVTPSSIDQPKRYEGKPGRIVGADGEETDVSTSRAQGKASPLSTLETHFPQQPAEPPPSGRPVLISPAQLKDIIERLSPSAFLLLDVRPFLQQSSSCINGALNMWMPRDLLKWPFFSTKMHQDTFSSDAEKERFAQWKSATYIIVYDASSSKLEGAVSAVNTLKKFSNEGWKGYSYILRGGFHEFSKRFPYFIHYRTEVDLGEAFSREYDA